MRDVLIATAILILIGERCVLADEGDEPTNCSTISSSLNITSQVLPSDYVIFNCTCEVTDVTVVSDCPVITGNHLDMLFITSQKIPSGQNDSCTVVYNITASTDFDRVRLQALLGCSSGNRLSDYKELVLEKSGDNGRCQKDIDCWSNEQVCSLDINSTEGKCSCPTDESSVYIPMLEHCYPASKAFGECVFNEQCLTPNTTCKEKLCRCEDGFIQLTDNTCGGVNISVTNVTFTSNNSDTLLPSDELKGTCYCESNNTIPCPSLEFQDSENMFELESTIKNDNFVSCEIDWQLKLESGKMDRPRVRTVLACTCGDARTQNHTFVFQKSDGDEACNEDNDCWSKEQVCNNGKCSCSLKSTPAYIKELSLCLPGSPLNGVCQYNEQCLTENSECMDKVCKCKEGFKVVSDNKCDAEGSSSSWFGPNLSVLMTGAIFAASRALKFTGA